MAITDEKTVLVLGAGTSAPFEMPLGGAMIEKIANRLGSELYYLDEYTSKGYNLINPLREASIYCNIFSRLAMHGALTHIHWNDDTHIFSAAINPELEKLRSLHKLLLNQTSETIDDFIVENPTYAKLVKIGIATQFFLGSNELHNNEFSPHDFHARQYPPKKPNGRNWVHLLINIIRHGIRSGNVTENNKIDVITFNYDKVIEYILTKQFANSEKNYGDYKKYVNILHVHGETGDIQDRCSSPARTCVEWADGIHVVNEESVPEHIIKIRAAAQGLILSAREIYFCGFSFSGPNCRLLGLDQLDRTIGKRIISSCNYDGNVGISKFVNKFHKKTNIVKGNNLKYSVTEVEEASGTLDRPIGVSDWLKLGYLGELPG